MQNKPLVSVIIFSYNHGQYLRQAIDSVLAQQTNFEFEVHIIDDASEDNSAALAKEVANNFPRKVFAYRTEENTGVARRALFKLRPTIRGEYFALLDGDDYWCDPHKLSLQVQFLSQNPDFVGCSHNTEIHYENKLKSPALVREAKISEWDLVDMAKGVRGLYCHTSSWLWRNICQQEHGFIFPPFMALDYYGDIFIYYFMAQFGKLKYIDRVMSVYRITGAGAWSKMSPLQQRIISNKNLFRLNNLTGNKYYRHFIIFQIKAWIKTAAYLPGIYSLLNVTKSLKAKAFLRLPSFPLKSVGDKE